MLFFCIASQRPDYEGQWNQCKHINSTVNISGYNRQGVNISKSVYHQGFKWAHRGGGKLSQWLWPSLQMVVITETPTFSYFVEKIHNSMLSLSQTFRRRRNSRNTKIPKLRSLWWCGWVCGVGGSRVTRTTFQMSASFVTHQLGHQTHQQGHGVEPKLGIWISGRWHWAWRQWWGWGWWRWQLRMVGDQNGGVRHSDKFLKKWRDQISSNPRNVLKSDFHFGISKTT